MRQDDDDDWTRSGTACGFPSSENDSEASAEVDAPEPTDDEFCDKEAAKQPKFRKSKKRKEAYTSRTTTLYSDSEDDILDFLDSQNTGSDTSVPISASADEDIQSSEESSETDYFIFIFFINQECFINWHTGLHLRER